MSQYDDTDERYADDEGYADDDTDNYDYSNDPNVAQVKDEPRTERLETVIPIGEAVTPETLHGVVAFTASVNLGTKDNNRHFRCELPFVVQPQWTHDQAAAQAASYFNRCVAVTLNQAGLPMAVDDEGILREVVKRFDGAQRVEAPRRRDDDRGDRRSSESDEPPGGFPHPADMRRPDHVNERMWRDLCENYDDWYDNRGDKASGQAFDSSPDFKRKDDGKGLWLRPFRRENNQRGGGDRGHDRRSSRNY